MSTLKVNQIQNLNGDVLLSSSGSDANLTLSGELRGPSTLVIDPAAIGDDTGLVRIKGDLEVLGASTTINSTTLTINDKNIVLGDGATTDSAADGGGITLKGATDKTFNWVDATDAWTSSENLNLLTGKSYEINGTDVLTATTLGSGVINSSLTSVGTLTSLTVSGTTTATSFIPTSSTIPTNGLYLPATNTVAVATNGVGRLFVNSTGFAGIGTSSPQARLEIARLGSNFPVTGIDGNVGILVTPGGGTSTSGALINCVGGDTGPAGLIFGTASSPGTGKILQDNTSLALSFSTNSSERLRITSTGLVGIGTSSPLATLHVQGGILSDTDSLARFGISSAFNSFLVGYSGTGDITNDTPAIYVTNTTGSTGEAGNIAYKTRTGSTNRSHIFYTGATPTERLRITSAGNVGIGTTSPGNKLVVAEAGTGVTAVSEILAGTIGNASSSNISRLLFSTVGAGGGTGSANLSHLIDSSQFVFRSETAGGHQWYVGGSERARIDSSGNVGIGTIDPGSKLAVNGSITESTDGGTTYHNVVTAQDIGTDPNQVPLNQFLGQLAFMDQVGDVPTASTPPQDNLSINFEYVSNTSIKIRMRGADGVVRSVTLTLS